MPAIWRECPCCGEWRTDVCRKWYGERQKCGDCQVPDYGSRRPWAQRRADNAQARRFHEETGDLLREEFERLGEYAAVRQVWREIVD